MNSFHHSFICSIIHSFNDYMYVTVLRVVTTSIGTPEEDLTSGPLLTSSLFMYVTVLRVVTTSIGTPEEDLTSRPIFIHVCSEANVFECFHKQFFSCLMILY